MHMIWEFYLLIVLNQMNKLLSPKREGEETYLIYTLQEGGDYKILQGFTLENFKQLVKDGYFELKTGDRLPDKIYPAFATLTVGIDNYDFVLQQYIKSKTFSLKRFLEGLL